MPGDAAQSPVIAEQLVVYERVPIAPVFRVFRHRQDGLQLYK